MAGGGEGGLMKKRSAEHQDRYFQVHHYMTKTDAWKTLSAHARAIYLQIGLRYSGSNNGRIAYSVRDAASECNIAKDTASRAFKELIDLGFIEETRHGSLSRKTRIASEWRLTAFKCDLTSSPKSCLFMQRGGQAQTNRQSRSRPQPSARLSQNTPSQDPEPVPNDAHDCPKTRPVTSKLSQMTPSQFADCPKRRPVKAVFGGSPVPNDGTLIIYHPPGDSYLGSRPPDEDAPEPQRPFAKPSARKPTGRSDDQAAASQPSHGPDEPRRPADEGEDDAPHVATATTPPAAARVRLIWTNPIIRELTGAEAIMRRAETLALEQPK
jgi:hypothetical protein